MFFALRESSDSPPEPDAAWEGWVPDEPDAVERVVEVAGMMASFAAQRLVRVASMRREARAEAVRHGLALSEVIDRSVRLELACALRITEYAAGELLALADAVVHRYPAMLESLWRAGMTEEHAKVLVAILEEVEPELREGMLEQGIALAETQPVGQFRRAMRMLADTVRHATLAERQEAALQGRRVVVEPAADGMAWLLAHIPAVEAHAAFGRITAIAKSLAAAAGEGSGERDSERDGRTTDQRRADVLCDLLIDGDTTGHPRQAHGIRASVVVTVPALSLLDESPSDGAVLDGAVPDDAVLNGSAFDGSASNGPRVDGRAARADPPVVEGIGPIPLRRARELCGGAKDWMRVLTHPETGMVLSVGRDQYRPPAALRRLVQWRADRCMAPGCGMPASRCEIDHQVAWEHGGHTGLENNAPFCKGHHTVKHHGGWIVRQIRGSAGAIEWTSPTGRRYVVAPERRVPVFRPAPGGSAQNAVESNSGTTPDEAVVPF